MFCMKYILVSASTYNYNYVKEMIRARKLTTYEYILVVYSDVIRIGVYSIQINTTINERLSDLQHITLKVVEYI